ncbi:MAG: STAS domain-containing protein [Phycisphaerales bacterium]|nr:STAS domain-containing protein [Phycisphaerales bacterium]
MSDTFRHVRVRDEGGVTEITMLDQHILDELVIRQIGEEIDQAMVDASSANMVLNFERVDHLSSSALGLLITLNSRLQDRDGGLCLIHIAAPIAEVFRITRLDQVLRSEADFASARSALLSEG